MALCALRGFIHTAWCSFANLLFLTRNRRIIKDGVDFNQIDKEWHWYSLSLSLDLSLCIHFSFSPSVSRCIFLLYLCASTYSLPPSFFMYLSLCSYLSIIYITYYLSLSHPFFACTLVSHLSLPGSHLRRSFATPHFMRLDRKWQGQFFDPPSLYRRWRVPSLSFGR